MNSVTKNVQNIQSYIFINTISSSANFHVHVAPLCYQCSIMYHSGPWYAVQDSIYQRTLKMKFTLFLTSLMAASRSRTSWITVPCSKAPRKSPLTTYFTKQVWNYTSFQAFTAQVIQTSLWGCYTVYSNKSIPAFENSMLPQYPGWKFVSGCWSDLEEEMCQLHTTVAMIAANQSYRALNSQFIPPKSWNKLCTYSVQFLCDFAYCLTNNFISDLKKK